MNTTNINNGKNTITIKGTFDCEGGVEDLKVIRTEKFEPYGALDFNKTIVFEGDIQNISKEDDEDEIKSFLEDRFIEEGFEIRFSIS